jgi:hypothetical protein
MHRRVLALVFLTVLPFVVYARVWASPPETATHFFGDPYMQYWGDLQLIAFGLESGQVPLWNPYDRAGYPACADPETGILYPIDWLLAVIAVAIGHVPFMLLQFKLLLHLSIAGLTMFAFLRARQLSELASLVGGVAFQLGIHFVSNITFALNWPAAWLPLVFLCIDWLLARPSGARAWALAGSVFLVVSAGSPPAAYYSLLAVVAYGVFALSGQLPRQGRVAWFKQLIPWLSLTTVLCVVVSAPTVLSGLVLTGESRLAERSYAFASSEPIPPADLWGFLLHSTSLRRHYYVGPCTLWLALLAAVRGRPRRTCLFFAGLAAFGFACALGDRGVVFRVVYELVPGAELFRMVRRYLFFVNVGLAVLAAYGLDAVLDRSRLSWRALGAWWGGAVVLLGVAYWAWHADGGLARSPAVAEDFTKLALLLVGLAVAVVLARAPRRPLARLGGVLILLLIALDLGHFGRQHGQSPGRFREAPYVPASMVERLRSDPDHRVYSEFGLGARGGTRFQIRDLRGYMDPLALGRYDDLFTGSEGLRHHLPELFALLNVRYLVHLQPPRVNRAHNLATRPEDTGFTPLGHDVFEVPDPAPNAYWVGSLRIAPDLRAVQADLWTVDWHTHALLAETDLTHEQLRWARGLTSQERARPAQVTERSLNRLALQVDAPADGLLVISEAWFPGWTAQVDGRDATILRVDSLLRGVPLAAGKHDVVLRFRPYYFLIPCWVALATLSLSGAAWLWGQRRARLHALSLAASASN